MKDRNLVSVFTKVLYVDFSHILLMANKEKEKDKISGDTKEVVKTIAKEAEKAEKAAERIMFVSKVKQLGMAIGGALLFFGLILFAVFGLIVMNRFPILVPVDYKFLVCAILILLGSLHILGGIALIA